MQNLLNNRMLRLRKIFAFRVYYLYELNKITCNLPDL